MELSDYIKFCQLSMDWCRSESEKATGTIMQVVDTLVEDAKRVSAMSDDALAALRSIKTEMEEDEGEQRDKVRSLTKALADLRVRHAEIGDIINPIIQSLQFQDRVSQNMQNLSRMMQIWDEHRGKDVSLEEFGTQLLEATTMESERLILRGLIAGLPEEEVTESTMFF